VAWVELLRRVGGGLRLFDEKGVDLVALSGGACGGAVAKG